MWHVWQLEATSQPRRILTIWGHVCRVGKKGTGRRDNGMPSAQKKTLMFNREHVTNQPEILDHFHAVQHPHDLGPLADDGTPYSAIGDSELRVLSNVRAIKPTIAIVPITESLEVFRNCQYGTEQNSGSLRKMEGSVTIPSVSRNVKPIQITYVFPGGSSQWIVGRNVTRTAYQEHIRWHCITFINDGIEDYLSHVDHNWINYNLFEDFRRTNAANHLSGGIVTCRTWNAFWSILHKGHRNVCCHARYTDFKLLLQRNDIFNYVIEAYISRMISKCSSCRFTAPPQLSRKVSISSLIKYFNDVVCLYRLTIDYVKLLHCMDIVSRYSTASVE